MRILIAGAGALGSVAGGLMADAGHTVSMVGRAHHMDAIASDGLRIRGIFGEHHVKNLDVHTDFSTVPPDSYDVIFVTVKSYDTAAIAESIKPFVGAETLVCPFQNGLGNTETLAAVVGWEHTIGARAIFGAWLPEDGVVEVTVIASPACLGVRHPSTPADRVRKLAEAMDAAGLPTEYSDRIETVLWSKVAYNCALNPMSALLDVPYGALLHTEHTREIMREAIGELYAVGNALNVALEPGTPEAYIDLLFDVLIPPTAEHYASMREDFRRGRRTEIDALNGAIWRYGAEHGIACPINATLTRLVHAREFEYGAG